MDLGLPAPKKYRATKTSGQQYEVYLNYLSENPAFRIQKFNPSDPHSLTKHWEILVTLLNACGSGAQNDLAGWKRVMTNWKCAVRAKARAILMYQKGTGGGPAIKQLTDVEERMLSICGTINITGAPDVQMFGGCIMKSSTNPDEGKECSLATSTLQGPSSAGLTIQSETSFEGISLQSTSQGEFSLNLDSTPVQGISFDCDGEELSDDQCRPMPKKVKQKVSFRSRKRSSKQYAGEAATNAITKAYVEATGHQDSLLIEIKDVLQTINTSLNRLCDAKLQKLKLETIRLHLTFPNEDVEGMLNSVNL